MRISNGFHLLTVCLGGLVLAGCVMTEKYDAEKARSLNFQRLLAQEEKRTGELDSELKRVTRDAAEHEGRNRELEAQLKAVREQLAGIETAEVTYRPLTKEIRTVGFVEFDERQLRRISARVKGRRKRTPRSKKSCW